MRKVWRWAAVVVVGMALMGAALWALSSELVFPFGHDARWDQTTRATCSDWLNQVAYADLSDGARTGTRPLELSCADAMTLPGLDLVSPEGIRVRLYDGAASEGSPIMLHVHGASGNVLHGAR